MTDLQDQWEGWRRDREERLRSPHGWLAITAIHWLTPDPQRFPDVPGAWHHDADGPAVTLDPTLGAPERLLHGDRELTEGTYRLGPLDEDGIVLTFGDARAEVADRDGRTIVRPRHPDSPRLRAYGGTPCYPPDPTWVLRARIDGEHVVLAYDGAEHRLVAWPESDGRRWILFRDATSGVTTYAAMRQVLTGPPEPDGTVLLDLNRAANMPCAYTPFATCPVPPPGNTLPFAVEAGEQDPTADR